MNSINTFFGSWTIPTACLLSFLFFTKNIQNTAAPNSPIPINNSPFLCSEIDAIDRQEIRGDTFAELSGSVTAISADGLVLAIGSPYYDLPNENAGRASVYIRPNTSAPWNNIYTTSSGAEHDQIGYSVAVSGDGTYVAIGVRRKDNPDYSPNEDDQEGEVRVIKIEDGAANIEFTIKGTNHREQFGSAISLSHFGDKIAIGTNVHFREGIRGGRVDLYQRTASGSSSQWEIIGSPINIGNSVVSSIDISRDDNRLVIGAWQIDAATFLEDCGAVSVYALCSDDWLQVGETILGTTENSSAGYSVAISAAGGLVAIGEPGYSYEGDAPNLGRGRVRTFEWINNQWNLMGANTLVGENISDNFGISLSLSDDSRRVAIGERLWDAEDTNISNDTGRISIYDWCNDDWSIVKTIEGESESVESGRSVSLSGDGNNVAIGEPQNDWQTAPKLAGRVRTYRLVNQ